MRESTDQKISEYGRFSRSETCYSIFQSFSDLLENFYIVDIYEKHWLLCGSVGVHY